MKSAIEQALDSIGKISVHQLEKPKDENAKENVPISTDDFYKPSLYLDDKQLITSSKYNAGDKIVLVIECTVIGTTQYTSMNDGKQETRSNIDLSIESIADITEG